MGDSASIARTSELTRPAPGAASAPAATSNGSGGGSDGSSAEVKQQAVSGDVVTTARLSTWQPRVPLQPARGVVLPGVAGLGTVASNWAGGADALLARGTAGTGTATPGNQTSSSSNSSSVVSSGGGPFDGFFVAAMTASPAAATALAAALQPVLDAYAAVPAVPASAAGEYDSTNGAAGTDGTGAGDEEAGVEATGVSSSSAEAQGCTPTSRSPKVNLLPIPGPYFTDGIGLGARSPYYMMLVRSIVPSSALQPYFVPYARSRPLRAWRLTPIAAFRDLSPGPLPRSTPVPPTPKPAMPNSTAASADMLQSANAGSTSPPPALSAAEALERLVGVQMSSSTSGGLGAGFGLWGRGRASDPCLAGSSPFEVLSGDHFALPALIPRAMPPTPPEGSSAPPPPARPQPDPGNTPGVVTADAANSTAPTVRVVGAAGLPDTGGDASVADEGHSAPVESPPPAPPPPLPPVDVEPMLPPGAASQALDMQQLRLQPKAESVGADANSAGEAGETKGPAGTAPQPLGAELTDREAWWRQGSAPQETVAGAGAEAVASAATTDDTSSAAAAALRDGAAGGGQRDYFTRLFSANELAPQPADNVAPLPRAKSSFLIASTSPSGKRRLLQQQDNSTTATPAAAGRPPRPPPAGPPAEAWLQPAFLALQVRAGIRVRGRHTTVRTHQ